MRFSPTALLLYCQLAVGSGALAAESVLPATSGSVAGPRNVILIIGDGMDDQQISIARNYLHGAAGKLLLDELPLRAAVGVLTVENTVGGKPIYVADSANTATSMATGAITSRGRIATGAGSDEDLTTVVELAAGAEFGTASSAAELAAAEPGQRLLGLFSAGTMPVRLRGGDGRTAEAPRPSLLNRVHRYLGSVSLPAPMYCEPNPAAATVPTLRQMTDAALAALSHDNPRGFFLLVESASIDKQAHERKPCGSIGELEQLEEALASALAFAADHPDTLVLVTADHTQAAQLVPAQSLFAAYPIPIYTPGKLARIETPEGSLMAVNYATNNFSHEEHTGANVPLFGNAVAVGRVPTYLQQPQIFDVVRDYLGL